MHSYKPIEIEVSPGLIMRARSYRGGEKTPVICIPGLTRNAADFEDFAPKIAGKGRNVLVVNLRGRGLSDYDSNYLNYHPLTYRDDVLRALDQLEIEKAVFVGTSLGGLVTMFTNEVAPERVKAAVINDIGPELATEGIERIAGYVGKNTGPAATIEEAAGRIKAINEVAFPGAVDADWTKFACRTFRLTESGWVLDYDPNIATALAEVGPAPDTWPAFESFKGKPLLIVRGEISDLLTPPIIEKMRAVNPDFDYAEVPGIGHAPMLTEPVSWTAIEAFLDKID